MGVMKEGLSAWPETIAYKRMLRNLIRAQEYVPPQQPTGTAPPPEEEGILSSDSANNAAGATRVPPAVQVGDWQIVQDLRGDLVARHDSGAEIVLAANPEGNKRG